MVRRDKRNIGKRVVVSDPCSSFYGRIGIVKGFRGDWGVGRDGVVVPYVFVYIDSMSSSFPLPGHSLRVI